MVLKGDYMDTKRTDMKAGSSKSYVPIRDGGRAKNRIEASIIVFYTLINKLPPLGNEWKMPFMFYTFPVLVNWFP